MVLIKAAIKEIDCDITVAYDGEEGLAAANKEMPDIIILDVIMPKMNGFKVCALLKNDSRFKNIPIIILSSWAGEDDISLANEVGAEIYMAKPVDQEKLLEAVKKFL